MFNHPNILEIIKESYSIAEVLNKLGLKAAGGNYRTFNKFVSENNIDTSHFSGQLWNKGKVVGPKRDIEDYLSNNFSITSYQLKRRLIKENIFENQCCVCKLKNWLDKPMPLELDHIDGNHLNNNLENLRLLCPNCHAQTDNYRAKNIRNRKVKVVKEKIVVAKTLNYCEDCKREIKSKSKYCVDCGHKNARKVERPALNVLIDDIKNLGYCGTGRKYGVSDNAVRKWLKTYT